MAAPIVSGDRQFPNEPPSAVYANARGAAPSAVAAANTGSRSGVSPAAYAARREAGDLGDDQQRGEDPARQRAQPQPGDARIDVSDARRRRRRLLHGRAR
jgi:hypothetical protein